MSSGKYIVTGVKRFILAIRWRHICAVPKLVLGVVIVSALTNCSPHLSLLDRVKLEGVLHVATTNSPTTCYQGVGGPAGYECGLLQRLADHLGVRLQLHYFGNAQAVLLAVIDHHAEVGSASIIVNDTQALRVHFTTPLREVTQQLVYHQGKTRSKSLDDLHGQIEVVTNSAAAVALVQHLTKHPTLEWKTTSMLGSEDLLYRVAQGTLTYTVASSDLIDINQHYYPDLKSAFDLSAPEPIAWALRRSADESLYDAVQGFIDGLGKTGLARLHDQYFNGRDNLDYLGVVRFSTDVQNLLPEYEKDFKASAKANGFDWRLLASLGYQESHWNPDAVSFTGVQGLMMLTNATATQLQIADRKNPQQSIKGAARYLSQLLQSLPDSIKQPDRTWMALASYNMGLGHLLDARILAQKRGGNPDLWKDVSTVLPLLMQDHWFSQTRYGYARGSEALAYVDNIRSYYDILIWITGGQSALVDNQVPTPKS